MSSTATPMTKRPAQLLGEGAIAVAHAVEAMLLTMVVGVIEVYRRLVSPLLPPACRFHPTCSTYAVGCLHRHGLLRGGWMSLRRIGRCHPFHEGGHDPIPAPPTDERGSEGDRPRVVRGELR